MKLMQALRRGLLAIAFLPSVGCSSQAPPMTTAGSGPTNVAPVLEYDVTENIAWRILSMDAQVKPVTDQMFQTLKAVTDDACATIAKLARKPDGGWDRHYAEAVLKCIDVTLINHGFLYPDVGGVDQLADALTPFQMSAARRAAFETQPHNKRSARMIAQRFPGPFYAVDCDTVSFIYLGVADRLSLPLHLVTIPAYNRRAGHAFVRWREGSHFLDWETMDGSVTTDDFYVKEWKLNYREIEAQSALADLSPSQVIGCEHYLLAIQYERLGNYEHALRELSAALALYPQSLDARGEFAWDTATGEGVHFRDNTDAIADALFVLNLVDDPDARDTLAAAYASAGSFGLAVKEERAAISNDARSSQAKVAYQQRLHLYQQHTVYRQSKPTHTPVGAFKP